MRDCNMLTMRKYLLCKTFMLIELLIVISIIAILASLLLPALTSARIKAKELACVSNAKQIFLGTALYANDFDSYIVNNDPGYRTLYGYPAWSGNDPKLSWSEKVWPYIGIKAWQSKSSASNLYYCPGSNHEKLQKKTNKAAYRQVLYGQDGWVTGNRRSGELDIRLNKIRNHSSVIFMFCRRYPYQVGNDKPGSPSESTIDFQDEFLNDYGGYPHKGVKNYIMLDGHISKYKGPIMPTDKRWARWNQ
jgi:type II secretory pathway pseudopilin PulG